MPPDPHVHVGVAALVAKEGDVLMVQRGGRGEFVSDGAGTWGLPGGWLEFGETPLEAAEREVLEETGTVIEARGPLRFGCALSQDGRSQIVTLHIACRYVSGIPRVTEPDKCPAVAWVPVAEVENRPLFAPLAEAWPSLRFFAAAA